MAGSSGVLGSSGLGRFQVGVSGFEVRIWGGCAFQPEPASSALDALARFPPRSPLPAARALGITGWIFVGNRGMRYPTKSSKGIYGS